MTAKKERGLGYSAFFEAFIRPAQQRKSGVGGLGEGKGLGKKPGGRKRRWGWVMVVGGSACFDTECFLTVFFYSLRSAR